MLVFGGGCGTIVSQSGCNDLRRQGLNLWRIGFLFRVTPFASRLYSRRTPGRGFEALNRGSQTLGCGWGSPLKTGHCTVTQLRLCG